MSVRRWNPFIGPAIVFALGLGFVGLAYEQFLNGRPSVLGPIGIVFVIVVLIMSARSASYS
jgi:hypothetical protein